MVVFTVIGQNYEEIDDVKVVTSIDKAAEYVYDTLRQTFGNLINHDTVINSIKQNHGYSNYSVFPKVIDDLEN